MPQYEYVARRKIKSGGKVYMPGEDIPRDVIAGWANPELWVASGDLKLKGEADTPLGRKRNAVHAPHALGASTESILKTLRAELDNPNVSKSRLVNLAKNAKLELGTRWSHGPQEELTQHLRLRLGMAPKPAPEKAPEVPPASPETSAGSAPTTTPEKAPEPASGFPCADCDKVCKTSTALASHRLHSHVDGK